MPIDFLTLIDILGTLAFAISGASMAIQKRLDVFGVLICAFATSIGGGTLRDLLLGDLPVGWLRNERIITVILVGSMLTLLFHRQVTGLTRTLFLFDSLGLGLFTIVGLQKGLAFGFSPGIAIALGTITACFGGVIRDVLLNNVPVIFHREIYASACIAGGLLYVLLQAGGMGGAVAQSACIITIVLIRIIAVRYNLSLPSFRRNDADHL